VLALLVALIASSPPDDPSAKAWAEGLASARAEERFTTIDAIEALGMKAMPTLRQLVATGRPEVRALASELIERIGARRLLHPTRVLLGPEQKTVADAVSALREQTGFLIDVSAADEAKRNARPVAIADGGPIPFFEAIDRLGASGGLRHSPNAGFTFPPRPGVRVRLVPHDGPTPPTSHAGPYRVVLVELLRHRSAIQSRKPADSKVREEFTATLEVEAEPGILIDRGGPIKIIEAIDDKGRDLRAPATSERFGPGGLRSWGLETLGTFSASFPMNLPQDRGTKIARLRGVVPVSAMVRTDELFSSPIDTIQGKELSSGGVTLRVIRVDLVGASGSLEIVVKGEPTPDMHTFANGPRQMNLATLRLPYNPDDHLRIEDADGNAYTTSSNGTSPPGPDGSMTYRVSLFPNRPLKPPAKLRYFGIAGVATEIPFDFRDLEIP